MVHFLHLALESCIILPEVKGLKRFFDLLSVLRRLTVKLNLLILGLDQNDNVATEVDHGEKSHRDGWGGGHTHTHTHTV